MRRSVRVTAAFSQSPGTPRSAGATERVLARDECTRASQRAWRDERPLVALGPEPSHETMLRLDFRSRADADFLGGRIAVGALRGQGGEQL
jgi:hypothetical protein